jgi:hypothetical protein
MLRASEIVDTTFPVENTMLLLIPEKFLRTCVVYSVSFMVYPFIIMLL